MKKILLAASFLFVVAFSQAQNPVSWSFTAKKINPQVYEVYMTASIAPGWHLYAQEQPKDAIAQPTSFSFNKNPLLILEGKVKEVGKLEKYNDKVLDVTAYQYSNTVNFVQRIKVKGKMKTNLSGSLEFQTCDDEKCLPPKTVPFTVALN